MDKGLRFIEELLRIDDYAKFQAMGLRKISSILDVDRVALVMASGEGGRGKPQIFYVLSETFSDEEREEIRESFRGSDHMGREGSFSFEPLKGRKEPINCIGVGRIGSVSLYIVYESDKAIELGDAESELNCISFILFERFMREYDKFTHRLMGNIMMHPNIGVCVFNIDCRVELLNRAMLKIIGIDDKDVEGKDYFNMMDENYLEWEREEAGGILSHRESVKLERAERVRKNGEKQYVDVSMVPMGWMGEKGICVIAQDITPQVKMENNWLEVIDELKNSYADLEKAMKKLEILHFTLKALTSTLDLDELLDRIMELAKDVYEFENAGVGIVDEETGTLLVKVHYYSDLKKKKDLYRLKIGEEGICGYVAYTGEPMVVSDVSKNPHYVEARKNTRSEMAVPIIVGGKVKGVLNFESDEVGAYNEDDLDLARSLASVVGITLQNAEMFSELQKDKEELQRLSKYKSDFVAAVTHDMRTPLTTIIGYMDILKTELGDTITSSQKRCIEQSIREARKLARIIEQTIELTLLDTNSETVENNWLSVQMLVSVILDDVYQRAEDKGIELNYKIDPSIKNIYTDEKKFLEIMRNLVDNAVKFSNSGGRVDLRVYRRDDSMVFEVADTGIGIPEGEMDKIFDRFYMACRDKEGHQGGVGLGLYIVREFTKLLGGRVEVESEVGKGSVFRVILPQPAKE